MMDIWRKGISKESCTSLGIYFGCKYLLIKFNFRCLCNNNTNLLYFFLVKTFCKPTVKVDIEDNSDGNQQVVKERNDGADFEARVDIESGGIL